MDISNYRPLGHFGWTENERWHGEKPFPLFKVDIDARAANRGIFDCFTNGYLGEGPKVAKLERELEQLFHQPTVLLNSGTSALTLAYYMAGFKAGDYVISTTLTCLATNMALVTMGVKILWADVDPANGMLDPISVLGLLKRYGDQVKGVVHVDWGGDVGHLKALAGICDLMGIPLIEDAAHTFSAYQDEPGDCDGIVQAKAMSYQAIKIFTCGDGGGLLVRSEPEAARARLLRWFGLDRTQGASMRCYQQVPEAGFKMHMNDIAASIGLAQLPLVAERIKNARANAKV